MDPVTQGVLGAVAAQAPAARRELAAAAVVGLLAGMAPDLDVLIRSPKDPLLFLEFHRHFTHSLLFIPVGGLLCAVVLHLAFARRFLAFRRTLLFATLGYATHGLLDACTTYGTQLLWPLSSQRFAWNNVAVIDPAFTLPLAVCAWLAWRRERARYAHIALAWALGYLLLGVVQRERAEAIAVELAAERGHVPQRLEAKPTIANLLVWKTVYATDSEFHVDAVRVGLFASRIYPGAPIARLQPEAQFPWLLPDTQQARDISRFDWFSDNYLAVAPDDPLLIVDIRYSLLPNQANGLWGIRLDRNRGPAEHVDYITRRGATRADLGAFRDMLLGEHGRAPPASAQDRGGAG